VWGLFNKPRISISMCVIFKQTLCLIHTKLSQSEHDTTPTHSETHVLPSLLMVWLYSRPHRTYCQDDTLSAIHKTSRTFGQYEPWPHQAHLGQYGLWPHQAHLGQYGLWPHQAHLGQYGLWPHQAHLGQYGLWPHQAHLGQYGPWPHQAHLLT